MNPSNPTETRPWYRRGLHALMACLAVLMMPLVLVYGAIMTTNILTHLRHSESWFYAVIWLGCLGLVLGLLWLLYRVFNKHRRLASGQELNSPGSH